MTKHFEHLLEQAQTGIGTDWLSERELLDFNEYLANAGFSISRMETIKTAGARTGRRLDYDILVLPEHEEGWSIFADPDRSRAHVVDIVDQAVREGGTFEFLVWAEKPSG